MSSQQTNAEWLEENPEYDDGIHLLRQYDTAYCDWMAGGEETSREDLDNAYSDLFTWLDGLHPRAQYDPRVERAAAIHRAIAARKGQL